MAAFIVTYDLKKENNREDITGHLKKRYSTWAMLSESSYAITTKHSPEQVFKYMKPMLDGNDQLYVITLADPHCGFGPVDINEWLERNL